ncbi:MAG: hypothetical protein LBT84_03805 [Spirochaetia bacterium]|jgi:hypothetical protein|nr:hypothetical protein [Spirochaetia bacterium]
MLNKYFEDVQKQLTKKKAAVKSPSAGKAVKSQTRIDKKEVMTAFSKIIPSAFSLAEAMPVDENGFAPEGADFLIFENYCADLVSMMEGYVPLELVHASCYLVPTLDKKTLLEALNRVVSVKKIKRYTDLEENELRVPAFIIAGDGGYPVRDVKNDILNYYHNKNVEPECEFEILVILNKGIIVKNWREKRNYIALETEGDTLLWFFILMNEYLDVKRDIEMDFRKYIKADKTYTEY